MYGENWQRKEGFDDHCRSMWMDYRDRDGCHCSIHDWQLPRSRGRSTLCTTWRIRRENVMKEILVTRRSNDYHSCLKDEPGVWGCGKTPAEAVGQMMMSHCLTFDIGIGYHSEFDNVFSCPCPAVRDGGKDGGICSYKGHCEYQSMPLRGNPPRMSCMADLVFFMRYFG